MIPVACCIVAALLLIFECLVGYNYSWHVATLVMVGSILGAVLAVLLGINAMELPPTAVSAHTPPSE